MKGLLALLIAILLLAPTGAQAAKVRTEHDTSANLGALKSWAWARPPLEDTGRTIGPDLVGLDKLVRANVGRELAAKGITITYPFCRPVRQHVIGQLGQQRHAIVHAVADTVPFDDGKFGIVQRSALAGSKRPSHLVDRVGTC